MSDLDINNQEFFVVTVILDPLTEEHKEEVSREKVSFESVIELQYYTVELGKYNLRQKNMYEKGIIPQRKLKKLITN